VIYTDKLEEYDFGLFDQFIPRRIRKKKFLARRHQMPKHTREIQ
jgi:hypothetical protein